MGIAKEYNDLVRARVESGMLGSPRDFEMFRLISSGQAQPNPVSANSPEIKRIAEIAVEFRTQGPAALRDPKK